MAVHDLKDQIARLPEQPGVYLWGDARGETIYVGKARSLRDRVRSYLGAYGMSPRHDALLDDIARLEVIVTDSVMEALALENNLIKQYKPRFNILLRDDKTYPYIKLTGEKYPRVYVTRRLKKDGSTYFGPYFPGNLAHRLVHFIHRHFKVPSCKVDLTRFHPKPCLQFHIHRCLGPCVAGLTTDEEYAEIEKAAKAAADEPNNWSRKLVLSAAREGPLFGKTGRLIYTELAILRFLIGHGLKLLFSRNAADAAAWTKLTIQADQKSDEIVNELLSRRK